MYTNDKLLVNVIEEKIPFTVVLIYNISKSEHNQRYI